MSKIVMANAAQIAVVFRGLGGDAFDQLSQHGTIKTFGVYQRRDGELVIGVRYFPGTETGSPPATLEGFRIMSPEDV